MKKRIAIISILMGIMIFPSIATADSPITSTDIYRAYLDYGIVEEANSTGIIDEQIAEYLADPERPIDVKAAIINALSWDFDGKANAEAYSKLIYDKSVEGLDMDSLSGDQLFCIGYLKAMDDYFNVDTAINILKLAEEKIPDSFTVSIVRALVESMNDFDNSWELFIKPVLQDKGLSEDMRQPAINIIIDYMAAYNEAPELNISRNNIVITKDTVEQVYLYGTFTFFEDVPYSILSDSDIADAEIIRDEYGIWNLFITGKTEGSSSILVGNNDSKEETIYFEVVSETVTEAPKTGSGPFSLELILAAGATLMAVSAKLCKKKEENQNSEA